jgi:hypothetical protein
MDEDVRGLYRELLHREPESEEAISFRRGRPLLDVALEFARSDEFLARARHTTDGDVCRLYRELLHREPESEEAISCQRGRPLLDVALEFAWSDEASAALYLRLNNLWSLQWRLHSIFLPGQPWPTRWQEEFFRILKEHRTDASALIGYFHAMALHRNGIAAGNPSITQSLRPNTKLKNFGTKVTLVVPTINSARWLGHIIQFYHEIGVPVLFAVDSRSSDGTHALVTEKGAAYIEVAGDHRRVEALMPDIVARTNTDWILRLDDDELPTPAMLDFVDQAVQSSTAFAYGFPRAHFRFDKTRGELQYSQFLPFGPFGDNDRQWRLFSRDGFRPDESLHTPGFVVGERQFAPPDAFIFHFNWVFRSLAERLEKLESYETQNFAKARSLTHYSLYETIPDSWHMFMPLSDKRYRNLAERICCSANLESKVGDARP